MMTTIYQDLLRSEFVDGLLPQEQSVQYSIDYMTPDAAVFPSTTDGILEVLSISHREGVSVVPYGGGIQTSVGNTPREMGVVLGLSSLNRMVDYQASDMTATLEAGMTVAEIQKHLSLKDQFLPIQAPCPDRATIGGILATGFSGPSRLSYGMARDWVIGMKVGNADGTITKSGGKVVKNVTGYDLNKLYVGSFGTLGVILEISFKLLPKPPTVRTMVFSCPSITEAAQATAILLSGYQMPNALVLVNAEVSDYLNIEGDGYKLLALFQGRLKSVETRLMKGCQAAKESGCSNQEVLPEGQSNALWQRLIDLGWNGDPDPIVSVRLNCLPSETATLVQSLETLSSLPYRHGICADMGSGSVGSLWWSQSAERPTSSEDLTQRVVKLAEESGCSWVIEQCPPGVKDIVDVWGPLPDGFDIMRRVKSRLDPAGILNPGRFVGGI